MPNEGSFGGVGRYQAFCALLGLLCLVFSFTPASATDVRITNLLVHPYSGGDGEVEFDLAWDNSWRSTTEPYNWDAVWVFCKIRRNGGDWQHLKIKVSGHTIPQSPQALSTAIGVVDTGAVHDASTNPAVGIFIYRTNDGFGTVTANDVRLRWNYADNGASSGDVVEIRVFGIEVVYNPEAAFSAGDDGTSTNAFRNTSAAGSAPWSIASEGAITTSATSPYYYPGGTGGDAGGAVFTIPSEFPKGYGAFYMAKGEIGQNAWIAFFNTLTAAQKTTRDITSNTDSGKNTDNISYRNNIRWEGSGEATLNSGTHGGVAMNWISWADLTAYLDWAGLRPMSELEYEKAARGPLSAVAGEYAWGSTTVTRGTSISDDGLLTERAHTGSNANIKGSPSLGGPLRVGSFAKGVTGRGSAGAGFYGALDLSGNVYERAVTVGNSTGRVFQGRYHGDGALDSSGNPNVTSWPGTDAVGAGYRGGGWDDWAVTDARLSDRRLSAYLYAGRYQDNGGRGVRGEPAGFTSGMNASVVIGQSSFTGGSQNRGSSVAADTLSVADGVDYDGTHLAIADRGNHRVLLYNSLPTTNGASADYVLGQSSFSTASTGCTGSAMADPRGVGLADGKVFVAAATQHRVLIWNAWPSANGPEADVALGQPDLTSCASNNGGRSARSFDAWWALGFFAGPGKVFVADHGNNRVLLFNAPYSTHMDASLVIGQDDFTSKAAVGNASNRLVAPPDAFSNGTLVCIPDRLNHRVLIYNPAPTTDGASATTVLGQNDFTSNSANRGGSAAANTLNSPHACVYSAGYVFVADADNHRVLIWKGLPTVNGKAADVVLGQANFTSTSANRGTGVAANTLNRPTALRYANGALVVADQGNHRVVVYRSLQAQ